MQDLHRNVIDIKERLRLDAERVKLEQQKLIEAEEAVHHQEERLRLTFEQLELHEGRYQAKGGRSLLSIFRDKCADGEQLRMHWMKPVAPCPIDAKILSRRFRNLRSEPSSPTPDAFSCFLQVHAVHTTDTANRLLPTIGI